MQIIELGTRTTIFVNARKTYFGFGSVVGKYAYIFKLENPN